MLGNHRCTVCQRINATGLCAGCGSVAVWVVKEGMVRMRILPGPGSPFSASCLDSKQGVVMLRPPECGFCLVQTLDNSTKGWVPVKLLKLSAWLVRQPASAPTQPTTPVSVPMPMPVMQCQTPSPSVSAPSTAASSPRGSLSSSPRGSHYSDSLRHSFDSSFECVDGSDSENPSHSGDAEEDIFKLEDVRKMLSVIRTMTA
eukprot:TRINITY_DN2391_c0_g1_i1.p1 TRINITY_DN2391_c0_g1~~TRINITY_DN2391_c0_g1_i1.p1  ORF type:complete len:201 (+),score=31.25 TRINITY_DN2391_c0_g1_i1:63-665(+)